MKERECSENGPVAPALLACSAGETEILWEERIVYYDATKWLNWQESICREFALFLQIECLGMGV